MSQYPANCVSQYAELQITTQVVIVRSNLIPGKPGWEEVGAPEERNVCDTSRRDKGECKRAGSHLVSLCPRKLPVATKHPSSAGQAMHLHLRYVMAKTATSGLARSNFVTTVGAANQIPKAKSVPDMRATQRPSAVIDDA